MLNQLKATGLSDKEARVYLAMIELGPASVLEIAAKAGVNRPTAYVEIESLRKKGLVSTQVKGKKRFFIPESPEQLEIILDKEKKLLEQKRLELTEILPELQGLFNLADEKPQVRLFEGKEGAVKMIDELLKTKDKLVMAVTSFDYVFNVFPQHEESHIPKRVKKGVHSKIIYTSSKGAFLKRHDEKMLRESKYISPDKFPFTADITISGDKIAITALKGKIVGIIIEHREIADSFRTFFKTLWDSIKEN